MSKLSTEQMIANAVAAALAGRGAAVDNATAVAMPTPTAPITGFEASALAALTALPTVGKPAVVVKAARQRRPDVVSRSQYQPPAKDGVPQPAVPMLVIHEEGVTPKGKWDTTWQGSPAKAARIVAALAPLFGYTKTK